MRRRRSVKISSIALDPIQWQNDALHILSSAHDYRSMNDFLMKKVGASACPHTHTVLGVWTDPDILGCLSCIIWRTVNGSKWLWIQILKVYTATTEPLNLKGSLPQNYLEIVFQLIHFRSFVSPHIEFKRRHKLRRRLFLWSPCSKTLHTEICRWSRLNERMQEKLMAILVVYWFQHDKVNKLKLWYGTKIILLVRKSLELVESLEFTSYYRLFYCYCTQTDTFRNTSGFKIRDGILTLYFVLYICAENISEHALSSFTVLLHYIPHLTSSHFL